MHAELEHFRAPPSLARGSSQGGAPPSKRTNLPHHLDHQPRQSRQASPKTASPAAITTPIDARGQLAGGDGRRNRQIGGFGIHCVIAGLACRGGGRLVERRIRGRGWDEDVGVWFEKASRREDEEACGRSCLPEASSIANANANAQIVVGPPAASGHPRERTNTATASQGVGLNTGPTRPSIRLALVLHFNPHPAGEADPGANQPNVARCLPDGIVHPDARPGFQIRSGSNDGAPRGVMPC